MKCPNRCTNCTAKAASVPSVLPARFAKCETMFCRICNPKEREMSLNHATKHELQDANPHVQFVRITDSHKQKAHRSLLYLLPLVVLRGIDGKEYFVGFFLLLVGTFL